MAARSTVRDDIERACAGPGGGGAGNGELAGCGMENVACPPGDGAGGLITPTLAGAPAPVAADVTGRTSNATRLMSIR